MSTLVETAQPAEEARPRGATSGRWIYRPWIDLLVGCGGWSAPLLALTFFAANSHSRAWPVAFYALALLFNYPHFMATVYRAYHSYSEFLKYRAFTVHVAVLLALAGVLAHVWYPALPWIFTLYVCWSPWHYTGQNFGILMLFAWRSGMAPSTTERRALWLAFVASFAMLMLSFQTEASGDPLVLSAGLPARWTLPLRGVLALLFVGASGWAFWSMKRRTSLGALTPSLLLAVTQFMWFLLPGLVELIAGSDVPQTRYSSGILAVLHSTQYLWITSYYQAQETRAAGAEWKLKRYLLTLAAGGILLFIPGPWIASRVFHADFAASFLTFTALVNLHHFILDGAIWKLRDSRIRSLLLNAPASVDAGGSRVRQNALRVAVSWVAGPSAGARAVRVAAVAALFLWAALDQLHFYLANETESVAELERAARLNPNDSSTQIRLARAEAAVGRGEAKLAALRAAANVSATNLSVQEAYGRGLIEEGNDEDAYAHYTRVLERWPKNVDALVNYGLLAARLGHGDDAMEAWKKAVDLAPGQANAQRYLAEGLEQRGEMQAAARHYRAYLGSVGAHASEHRGEEAAVLTALIKVADADASANRSGEAQVGYEAAARYAQVSGKKELTSLALAHLAELKERTGNLADAARAHQKALVLDDSSTDRRDAGIDWLNYGQFLRRHGGAERLVLACLLKAEELLQGALPEELSAVAKVRAESEARLGREASGIRQNRDGILREALAVTPEDFSKTH
jgi:tetratricopeptide (TPR) repeat protein